MTTNVSGIQMAYKVTRSEKINAISDSHYTIDIIANAQNLEDIGQIISQNIESKGKYGSSTVYEVKITYGIKNASAMRTVVISIANPGNVSSSPEGNRAMFPLGKLFSVGSLTVFKK
ncbi:TPA: hypothetical protein DCZ36_01670 [Candidatus Gracilibacteria bacterium]|nr:hypothetical protein [Candidatus Gracilibacteria bacterium]